MRLGSFVLLLMSATGVGALAQQTPANPPRGAGQSEAEQDPRLQRPLTPVEVRDKEVRQFDPLAPTDEQPSDGQNAAPDDKRTSIIPAVPPNAGPKIISADSADTAEQEYTGPAVLSRSYTVNRPQLPKQIKWQEFVGFSQNYNTGVGSPALDGVANVQRSPGVGEQLNWGITGGQLWRHDQLGISYNGSNSHYGGGAANGTNQALTLELTHILTRHLSVSFSESGTIQSRSQSLEIPTISADTTLANINVSSSPNIQIFDLGTKQFTSQIDVTWQTSARLSFNAGISYFVVLRNAPGLLGSDGRQARGDFNYRLNRKTTTGVYYSFNNYVYPHGSGNTDTNTLGLIFSYAFDKSTQLSLRAGISSSQSLSLTQVQIQPAIAALLGQSAGIIDLYRANGNSDISAQFKHTFRGGRAFFAGYARGLSPGNGIYQASQQESVSAGTSVKLYRGYSLNIGAGYDTLFSSSQSLGKYSAETAQISTGRTYRRGFSVSIQTGWRHIDIANTVGLKNQLNTSFGVNWSPGTGRLLPW